MRIIATFLRTEYLENPIGIDVTRPRFSWQLQSSDKNARNQKQTAYQILVASSEEQLASQEGDFWDSGKIASAQMNQVVYAGTPLKSRNRCYWKVRVWDENDAVSTWSEPAMFTMGLLNSSDWIAKWIGAPPEIPNLKSQMPNSLPEGQGLESPCTIPPPPILRKSFHASGKIKYGLAYVTGRGGWELRL